MIDPILKFIYSVINSIFLSMTFEKYCLILIDGDFFAFAHHIDWVNLIDSETHITGN